MNELEPLLKRIEQLTPYFGRASEDLAALTTRGRNQDYKGVLQNARLVLEMLLRSLVTTELKQTPGKAMLDELLNKFRQQVHSGGLIPINILGHMGTVQAWGNLSSHDHAGGLGEAPVKVGLEEALASLNSLVAILSWYRERYVPEPAPAPVPSAQPASNRRLVVAGGAAALVAAVTGAALLMPPEPPAPAPSSPPVPPTASPAVTAPSPELRLQVDQLYVESEDPAPPADCKETTPEALALLLHVGPLLSERVPEQERVQKAVAALQVLRSRGQAWKPEGWYHVARASVRAKQLDGEAMTAARLCNGFTAAENLAAKMAAMEGDWEQSEALNARTVEMDANYWKPRYNLAIIYFSQERYEEALPLLERASQLAPNNAEVHYFLGHSYLVRARRNKQEPQSTQDEERALAAYCRARELGYEKAAKFCPR